MHLLRVYAALLRASLQNATQYRAQMFLWLLMAVVRPVVFLAAWSAVAVAEGGSVGGFSPGAFAAYYVALAAVTQLTNSWDAWEFELEVRQGKLSPKLLRPLHPIHYAVVENLTWKIFTVAGLLPILVLIGWTFGAEFSTQPWQVALFVPSVILGAVLRFLFGWALALTAFWTTRVESLITLSDRVAFIFAGQVAPLALLPGPLQAVAYGLPYGYMLGVPAQILTGSLEPSQALLLVGGQVVWVALAYAVYHVVWRIGIRQYSAVGA